MESLSIAVPDIGILGALTGQTVAFYAFSALAIGAAILMVTQKNPVASALWLVLSFLALAGLFVVMQAYFIAVVQVLVYAGAIMVLFLFVIMLLDLRMEDLKKVTVTRIPAVGVTAAVLFLVGMVSVVSAAKPFFGAPMADYLGDPATMGDSIRLIGIPLFSDWLLPFEVTSILLLVAIVGAVALTKRKL
jgi:NADH-quinone oxidoreductase subunit J